VSAGLRANIDTFEVAATPSRSRIEITMKITLEVDDAQALAVVLKLVAAVAVVRGEGRESL
jgi:hypothetical protein